MLVLGDFNQRIPRTHAPIRVAKALEQALGALVVAPAGAVPGIDRQVIDHLAHPSRSRCATWGALPASMPTGVRSVITTGVKVTIVI